MLLNYFFIKLFRDEVEKREREKCVHLLILNEILVQSFNGI